MRKLLVPLKNPRPDIENFLKVIKKERIPSQGIIIEHSMDEEIRRKISIDLLGLEWKEFSEDRGSMEKYLGNYIQFWYKLGYDYVRFEIGAGFTSKTKETQDTASLSRGKRQWAEEKIGMISSWKDFEAYHWPRIKDVNFTPYEFIAKHLPEGMGFMVSHGGGILENVTWLMGHETLCYSLYDKPDLVNAIFNRVGEIIYEFHKNLIGLPGVVALFQGDDTGFKSSTFISPDALRKYVFPWHKKIAQLAHDHHLLYILHNCGYCESIMEDLIEDVKIDGKHSFEDEIMPVAEFKKKYGDRLAILGGVDIDKLSRLSEEDLRRYVRKILSDCMRGGGYALGSGNSITNYIPLQNYLIMLDEGLRWKG